MQEEASPRSHGRNRQRLGGLGKPLIHPRTAAPSVLTAADRARGEAAIDGDDAGMDSPDGGQQLPSCLCPTTDLRRMSDRCATGCSLTQAGYPPSALHEGRRAAGRGQPRRRTR
jgi:hypothetical protein